MLSHEPCLRRPRLARFAAVVQVALIVERLELNRHTTRMKIRGSVVS